MADALIVADTGPLIALSHIDAVHVLKTLYAEVFLPHEVAAELRASRFEYVHNLVVTHPWLQVRSPIKEADAALRAALDPGEVAAIGLALEMKSPLLIDGRRGRRIAHDVYGVEVRGTLATLVRARQANLIGPLSPLLETMRQRGEHLSASLIRATLAAAGEYTQDPT